MTAVDRRTTGAKITGNLEGVPPVERTAKLLAAVVDAMEAAGWGVDLRERLPVAGVVAGAALVQDGLSRRWRVYGSEQDGEVTLERYAAAPGFGVLVLAAAERRAQ